MRSTSSKAIATVCAVLVVMGGAGASAASSDLRVTVKYRETSNEVVGEQRFLTLVGAGHSAQLGTVDVTSSVVATPPFATPCLTRTANEVWTTPTGSLQVDTEGVLCMPQGKITGSWTIVGGSGSFASASGAGGMSGTLAGQGNVFISYTGTFSL